MRVLVTGAAGMIGSHLVDHLLDDGAEVVGFDNLLTGREINLRAALTHPRFEFVLGDVCDGAALRSIGAVARVFHLACPASPVDFDTMPIEILRAGSVGTLEAASFALEHGARLVLASTSEVYGDPEVHPQVESYFGNVNPVGPRACYDEGKRFSEAVVSSFARTHGLDAGIARIFNTYGPRMRVDDGRVIPNFVVQALRGEPLTVKGSGEQTRSFCYVADLVGGLDTLMGSRQPGPFNLGTDEELTVMELANLVIELTNSTSTIEYLPLPEDDPVQRRPDTTASRERLEWRPTIGLREGLGRAIEYYVDALAAGVTST